ncbi:MAG: GNAT family N-acetyltransferase [Myxococcota bacterium]
MKYGIQRRTIYLVPPSRADLDWMFHQFDVDEIWQMFGMPEPSRHRIMFAYRHVNLVIGMIRRVHDRARIGFMVMIPPRPDYDFWEACYAIPDPRHRDAWAAFNAADAMTHYMLEHLRVNAMGWCARVDNVASDAIIRRLGYIPDEVKEIDGHKYRCYRLQYEGWMARRARLDRGERLHPSGQGETFVTLREPPYEPIVLMNNAA